MDRSVHIIIHNNILPLLPRDHEHKIIIICYNNQKYIYNTTYNTPSVPAFRVHAHKKHLTIIYYYILCTPSSPATGLGRFFLFSSTRCAYFIVLWYNNNERRLNVFAVYDVIINEAHTCTHNNIMYLRIILARQSLIFVISWRGEKRNLLHWSRRLYIYIIV